MPEPSTSPHPGNSDSPILDALVNTLASNPTAERITFTVKADELRAFLIGLDRSPVETTSAIRSAPIPERDYAVDQINEDVIAASNDLLHVVARELTRHRLRFDDPDSKWACTCGADDLGRPDLLKRRISDSTRWRIHKAEAILKVVTPYVERVE